MKSIEIDFAAAFDIGGLETWIGERISELMDEFQSSVYFEALQIEMDWMQRNHCHVTYHIRSYEVVEKLYSVFETPNLVVDGTTAYKTWPASIHLANFIAQNVMHTNFEWKYGPEKWKNVFELGSGLVGFLGVTMQEVLSSPNWTFSDVVMDDGSMIRANAELNPACKKMQANFLQLDWDFPLPNDINPIELIVATDVIYDPEITVKFLTIAKQLIIKGTRRDCHSPDFLLCNAIRQEYSHEHFLKTAREMNFKIQTMDRWSGLKWSRELRERVLNIQTHNDIPVEEISFLQRFEGNLPLTGDDTPTVVYYLTLDESASAKKR